MANKTLTMLQIRRIIQFLEDGYSIRKIAYELKSSRNTIGGYVEKIKETGKEPAWLLAQSDAYLGALMYRNANELSPDPRYEYLSGQFDYYRQELKRTGVTRLLLWQEYRAAVSDGYGYSQFCEHLATDQKKTKATMHFDHIPGEQVQIDFAGKEIVYVDRLTGEIINCPVLVCVFPYSGYTYVEALASTRQEHLFPALCRCMEYFGGGPRSILSDNMKQYVKKSNRYEPIFTESSEQWALHYHTSLFATRPGKPKDKPSVEKMVDITYMRIYAPLRNEVYHSLSELNKAIEQQLYKHNHTLFQKRPYSRYDLFIAEEQSLLKPLPAEPFILKHTTSAKVGMNYHVILGEDWHYYSVPYQYIGKQVKLVYDYQEVEIYLGLNRIAIHKRNFRQHHYTTLAEHMPEKHQKYHETKGWNGDYFLNKAKLIGENTQVIMSRLLESRPYIEQSYLACQGFLRLSDRYGKERLENACRRALPASRISYRIIDNILKNNLDRQQEDQLDLFTTIPDHENIRGPESYQ